MNKFARHYIKHAFEEQPAAKPKHPPGTLLKILKGAVAGAGIGALGGGGVGAMTAAYNAPRSFYNGQAAAGRATDTAWQEHGGKGVVAGGYDTPAFDNERRLDKYDATATGGAQGALGGALAGGLIGAVANPLFN